MKTLNDIPDKALANAKLNITLMTGEGQVPIDIAVEDISYDAVGDDPILDLIGYLPHPDTRVPYRLFLWSAYQYGSWSDAYRAGALYPLDHLDYDTLDFSQGALADLVETLDVVSKCFGCDCVKVVAMPIAPLGAITP